MVVEFSFLWALKYVIVPYSCNVLYLFNSHHTPITLTDVGLILLWHSALGLAVRGPSSPKVNHDINPSKSAQRSGRISNLTSGIDLAGS